MIWSDFYVSKRVGQTQNCCDLLMAEVLTDSAGKKPVQEDGRVYVVQFPFSSIPLEPLSIPCTQPLDNTLPQVPSIGVEGEVEFAKPVKTTAQILHDGSNVVLPPGGSMDSVVASTSKFDWLDASCKETSVVMSTVSVQPCASLGPVFSDTSVIPSSADSLYVRSRRMGTGKLVRKECNYIMVVPKVDVL